MKERIGGQHGFIKETSVSVFCNSSMEQLRGELADTVFWNLKAALDKV